jgi:hypothetical protein
MVSLHLFDVNKYSKKKVDLGIIKILYCNECHNGLKLNVLKTVLNRHQDNLDLLFLLTELQVSSCFK